MGSDGGGAGGSGGGGCGAGDAGTGGSIGGNMDGVGGGARGGDGCDGGGGPSAADANSDDGSSSDSSSSSSTSSCSPKDMVATLTVINKKTDESFTMQTTADMTMREIAEECRRNFTIPFSSSVTGFQFVADFDQVSMRPFVWQ